MSERELLESSSPSVFEKIIVARTLATWYAADGSVAVQIANPSCDGVALPIGLCLGQLFTVSVVTPDQLHINAVAKTINQLMNSFKPNLSLKVPCPKHLLILSLQPTRKHLS